MPSSDDRRHAEVLGELVDERGFVEVAELHQVGADLAALLFLQLQGLRQVLVLHQPGFQKLLAEASLRLSRRHAKSL